uniref:Uncharacterized protein n=1 Tax=viral metagenome TaxID=1070528 RepID=A0A6M3IDU3_9ZZZZ
MLQVYDEELCHAVKMARLAVEEAEDTRQECIGDYTNKKMIILSITDVRTLLEIAEGEAQKRGINTLY